MRIAALFCLAGFLGAQSAPDALLNAMKDELERSRTLQFSGLDKPYYIEYTVEDQTGFSVSASLGGILYAKFQSRPHSPHACKSW